MSKCPKCKMEIDSLDFDVKSSCSGSIYEENIRENSWGKCCIEAYDSDCLFENVSFDNFRCPECEHILAHTEEEALNFFNGDKK